MRLQDFRICTFPHNNSHYQKFQKFEQIMVNLVLNFKALKFGILLMSLLKLLTNTLLNANLMITSLSFMTINKNV